MVLIDTSAWVEFLRTRESVLSNTVKKLIEANTACLTNLIRVEILSGAKNDKDFQRLDLTLASLHLLTEPLNFWDMIAHYRYRLARKGLQISIPDLSIALLASIYKCDLLTSDKAFHLIKKVLPLRFHERT